MKNTDTGCGEIKWRTLEELSTQGKWRSPTCGAWTHSSSWNGWRQIGGGSDGPKQNRMGVGGECTEHWTVEPLNSVNFQLNVTTCCRILSLIIRPHPSRLLWILWSKNSFPGCFTSKTVTKYLLDLFNLEKWKIPRVRFLNHKSNRQSNKRNQKGEHAKTWNTHGRVERSWNNRLCLKERSGDC